MIRFPSSNIAHTALTDHRISRFPPTERPGNKTSKPSNGLPLVYFHQELVGGQDQELDRDLGIALIDLASKKPSKELGKLALPLLEPSLRQWPEDVAAREAKGYALMLEGRGEEALAAFEATLATAPRRERTLFAAALLAGQMGLLEISVKYWQQAMEVNPWNWEYHDELAKELGEAQEWPAATAQCRQAIRLNPAAWETRKLLVKCLLRQKDQKQARTEFDILLGFQPPDLEALRRWFDQIQANSE
jgi:tetratricopeptide (TPR) repeat protein